MEARSYHRSLLLLTGFLVAIFACNPSQAKLIAYWSFDQCTASDDSGNGYDGQTYNSVQCVDGVWGKAMSIPTSDGYIGIEKDFAVEDFTLSFWVKLYGKPGTTGHAYNMFFQGASELEGAYKNEFNFAIRDTDNAIEFCWREECYHSPGYNLFDNKFHHLVYVKNGNSVEIYVDGTRFYTYGGSFTGNAQVSYAVMGQDQDCLRGCFESDQFLKGAIDEVRLYDTALSEAEIVALYQNPGGEGACSSDALEKARQEGFQQGVEYCRQNPAACGLSGSSSCATFDFFKNTLHVPCLGIGTTSYWLDLQLEGTNPVRFRLSNFGQN